MTPAVRASWRLIANVKKHAVRQEREARVARAQEVRVAEAAAQEVARASSTCGCHCRRRDCCDVCSVLQRQRVRVPRWTTRTRMRWSGGGGGGQPRPAVRLHRRLQA